MPTSCNLNDRVTVTLREPGVECLERYYEEIDKELGQVGLTKQRAHWKTGDQWSGQLYELCNIFGPKMELGSDTPVETIIEIDVP